jgi:RimJ/RimL family protein N-acetyltransferase
VTGVTAADPLTPQTRQSYLIGESIYLRALELGDAKWASAWRPSPFPISAKLVAEQLKKELPDEPEHRTWRIMACRRSDGRPLGSAVVEDQRSAVSTWVSLCSDPTLGAGGSDVQAEMLELLVQWLSGERNRPVVVAAIDAGREPVVAAAEALGMRLAVRLRDGLWREGSLRDRLFYELAHPAWLRLLGDPGPGIADAGEPVTSPRAPAPRRLQQADALLPPNAIIASERLALRPMQVEDAEEIASLIRNETDVSFGEYRVPYSPVALSDWFGKIGKNDPAKETEFAIVLRETGHVIGENGLYDIDWLARNAESGTWIYRPEYRGGGFGTEAKHLLLEYAFERLGLHMIWSWVKSRNVRSQAALRKQGYRDAGRFSWTNFGPDGLDDARMFDLLAAEWRAARRG